MQPSRNPVLKQQLSVQTVFWLVLLLALCAAAYWCGLYGGYVFDDFSNIVNNPDVHVSSLSWAAWRKAALASPSPELRRPLAMLSFAVNEYFTGADPFPMKLTNLVIHLLNGLLLYGMIAELFRAYRTAQPTTGELSSPHTVALFITAAWLLAPINVSAVLYIVQRMESMAQMFVLMGLWGYLRARRWQLEDAGGELRPWLVLMSCTALGVLAKETAALLPLYAFLIELTVLNFRMSSRRAQRRLWASYAALVIVPGILGTTLVTLRALHPGAYALRPFTLDERLLTELRVVSDYVYWTLLPPASTLGFYHDDIQLSTGWLAPPATLLSAVFLAGLLLVSLLAVRRRPLFSLGILWFFASNALTATVIPLELVFEHRNYFPSLGLFLAFGSLLSGIPDAASRLRWPFAAGLVGLFCFVTATDAEDWSNQVIFAQSQAEQHPQSPRANYELGRTLVIASQYKSDSPLLAPAIKALEAAAKLPGSSTLPDAALILTANHAHIAVNDGWWTHLVSKLRKRPPSAEDVSALTSLMECQKKRECKQQPSRMLSAFLAALSHEVQPSDLLLRYAEFADMQLHDEPLAERVMSQAVRQSPDRRDYRLYLSNILMLQGKYAAARKVLPADIQPLFEGSAKHQGAAPSAGDIAGRWSDK
jgi:hypothetical protein